MSGDCELISQNVVQFSGFGVSPVDTLLWDEDHECVQAHLRMMRLFRTKEDVNVVADLPKWPGGHLDAFADAKKDWTKAQAFSPELLDYFPGLGSFCGRAREVVQLNVDDYPEPTTRLVDASQGPSWSVPKEAIAGCALPQALTYSRNYMRAPFRLAHDYRMGELAWVLVARSFLEAPWCSWILKASHRVLEAFLES